MVVAAQKTGFDASFFLGPLGLSRLAEFAFDSDRKLMSVIYQQSKIPADPSYCLEPDIALVLVKGAPEGVLSKCVSYLAAPSSSRSSFVSALSQPAVPLTSQFVDFVSQRSAQMASQGLRVLALALKTVSIVSARDMAADTQNAAAAESSLIFVGLVGLIDPARYYLLLTFIAAVFWYFLDTSIIGKSANILVIDQASRRASLAAIMPESGSS
ncbi:hypothetical protein BVRB_020620 [Beta vulgaris subsp. vulgaris]|uniref:Uncharacterized protein n=1 Tax=Beta vulgaris subsp. vulgaris TaxID=3555 RepID=A0A0J8B3V5_BETVV|nr:hypothetical protein BVRB_020620 [Beta vulgaris subsp. vulgaris]